MCAYSLRDKMEFRDSICLLLHPHSFMSHALGRLDYCILQVLAPLHINDFGAVGEDVSPLRSYSLNLRP